MATAAASPPLPAASGPVVACPYTAGGCPLFQTYDVNNDQRCAGSCSPAPPPQGPAAGLSSQASSTSSSAAKRAAPSSFTADEAAFLSELTGESGVPLPSALIQQDSWSGYLGFGISPGQLEMPSAAASGGTLGGASCPPTQAHNALPPVPSRLWDLEDLVSKTNSYQPKRMRTTPPLPSNTPRPVGAYPHTDVQVDDQLQFPKGAAGSPTSVDEDDNSEVVTPFISKLSYLLQHSEFEPWLRWDSSGQYLLVAHTKPHLLHILERFFRHTVTSSFIRQLNIYGFRRASTAQLLNILDSTTFASSVTLPDGSTETFSAADFSAFGNPLFFRSVPGGPHCRLGALKPITKERGPRNRGKKAQAAAASAAAYITAAAATETKAGTGPEPSVHPVGGRKKSGLATPSDSP